MIAGVHSPDYAMSRIYGQRAHIEALLRRLSTPAGGLLAAPTYGYDLRGAVGASVGAEFAISQRVREQCLADERTADAAVATTTTAGVLAVTISVQSSDGPFDLIISGADELTVAIITQGAESFWGLL